MSINPTGRHEMRQEMFQKILEEAESLHDGMDDILIGYIDINGRLAEVNRAQLDLLGCSLEQARNAEVEQVYTAESAAMIRGMLAARRPVSYSVSLHLGMVGSGGRHVPVLGRARFVHHDGRTCLRIIQVKLGEVGERWQHLKTSHSLLENIVEGAKEAHWAIEFLEPVDVNQPRGEIVRQVFENESVWRLCNAPMARIYGLAEGARFKENSVRLYWQRSPENESFVESIIEAGFSIDDALSVDRRHDGSILYMRNDVRADIHEGRLLRIWGNGRDITPEQEAQSRASKNVEAFAGLFDALPDPALLLSASGDILRRNLALTDSVGDADVLEIAIQNKVKTQRTLAKWSPVRVPDPPGEDLMVEMFIIAFAGPSGEQWYMAMVRQRPAETVQRRRKAHGKLA